MAILETGLTAAITGEELVGVAELSGGEWDATDTSKYVTKNFEFWVGCVVGHCYTETYRLSPENNWSLSGTYYPDGSTVKTCHTQLTDTGRMICKDWESRGYTYLDGEL